MSQKGTYYQFNIDFNGNYIRGYVTSTLPQNGFLKIKQPTYSNSILSDIIKPINDEISLSINAVVCYFKINEN